ncbi:hypothetical protein BH09PAT3_BH09PAT3_6130 [soil metagenome]
MKAEQATTRNGASVHYTVILYDVGMDPAIVMKFRLPELPTKEEIQQAIAEQLRSGDSKLAAYAHYNVRVWRVRDLVITKWRTKLSDLKMQVRIDERKQLTFL